jgi:hypothetical protein
MKKRSGIDHLKVESRNADGMQAGEAFLKAQKVEKNSISSFLPIFEIPLAFLILWCFLCVVRAKKEAFY